MLAVGFRELEEFLQKKLRNEFKFVGVTVYREGIIRSIGQTNPDIVVIRETLEGKENILTIVYEIRTKYPKVRIVFIAGKREPGDALLATLVNYGVYDILYGEKIPAQSVISLLRKPNEYKDVQHLQPKPVLDEKRNKVLFESPEAQTIEKEVIKEVYVNNVVELPKNPVPDPPESKEKIIVSVKDQEPTENKTLQLTHEELPKEKRNVLEKFWGKEPHDAKQINFEGAIGKQKIVTFMGAKSGIGNTSVALNTAVQLAKKNLRVIFIEFNERTPSVNYWYELGYVEDGIDSAIRGLQENDFERIEKAIIRTSDLMKKETSLQKNYKRFPKKLDFMFFSNQYLTRRREEIYDLDLRLTKELCLYLLFQMDYDYVILDVSSDIESDVTLNALLYSNKVFITVTQDVSSIGNALYIQNELTKLGIHITKKMYYVINRFEDAELDAKEISDWIQTKNVLTVPCLNKEFINANFVGMPVILYSKNQQLRNAFQDIEKTIL